MPASNGRHLAHLVYFELRDDSPEAAARLVESCHQHLSGHDGTVFFSAGPRAADYDRPVNDQKFDVALVLVFENEAAHDAYQIHPRHLKFVEDNKESWASVRVFDALVSAS